jgi:hypothetical protein
MAEFVQACLFRDVDEYDWGAVHKSSRRDRAGHGIFHGGVRSTSGNSRGFRFFRLTILGFLGGGAWPEPSRNEDKRERTQAMNISSHLKSFRFRGSPQNW